MTEQMTGRTSAASIKSMDHDNQDPELPDQVAGRRTVKQVTIAQLRARKLALDEKVGAENKKNLVDAAHGSNGESRATSTAEMWPNIHRAPLKDAKHAMSLVTDNTYGPSHNFHPFFCAAIKRCILDWVPEELEKIVDIYMKEFPNISRDMAITDVTTKAKWKNKIANTTLPTYVGAK